MKRFERDWILVYEEDEDLKYKEFDSTELALQFVSLAEVKFVALMSKKYAVATEEAAEEMAKDAIACTVKFFLD
jgi:hypothetical protein